MSTRSYIAEELPNGKYKVIYCHFDGNIEHNGEILINHYQDRNKLEKLLSLGDLSSLDKNIEPNPSLPHSLDYKEQQKDVCVFYNRDGKENNPDWDAKVLTKEEMFDNDWIEYFYIFTLEDKWKYYDYEQDILRDVAEDLEKLKQEQETYKKQSNDDEEM